VDLDSKFLLKTWKTDRNVGLHRETDTAKSSSTINYDHILHISRCYYKYT